jgi:hypothetical protein
MSVPSQCIAAAIGVAVSAPFLVPLQAPGLVYALIGGATAWAWTWWRVRRKFGRDVIVRPSLRADE